MNWRDTLGYLGAIILMAMFLVNLVPQPEMTWKWQNRVTYVGFVLIIGIALLMEHIGA